MVEHDIQKIVQEYQLQPNICRGAGCEHCGGTGFKGRVAILEYLPNDENIQSLPKDHTFLLKVAEYRRNNALRTLREDGYIKILKGKTTYEEVLRVAG